MTIDIPNLSERRQSPRYNIRLDVDIVLDNGNIVSVSSKNISSSGMQIACDDWVTNQIEPRGIQNHALSHIRLKVVTELPIEDEHGKTAPDDTGKTSPQKLYARCRIMSVQRMSQDKYNLNLAFIDFENGSEQLLDKLLDHYEQKKTVIKVRAIA
jgi:hypothetical protein